MKFSGEKFKIAEALVGGQSTVNLVIDTNPPQNFTVSQTHCLSQENFFAGQTDGHLTILNFQIETCRKYEKSAVPGFLCNDVRLMSYQYNYSKIFL